MSLKTFHLIFITLAVLLCLGFGLWCLLSEDVRGRAGYAVTGVVSILFGIGVVLYEVRLWHKVKDLE